jgi:hypothetical protein
LDELFCDDDCLVDEVFFDDDADECFFDDDASNIGLAASDATFNSGEVALIEGFAHGSLEILS